MGGSSGHRGSERPRPWSCTWPGREAGGFGIPRAERVSRVRGVLFAGAVLLEQLGGDAAALGDRVVVRAASRGRPRVFLRPRADGHDIRLSLASVGEIDRCRLGHSWIAFRSGVRERFELTTMSGQVLGCAAPGYCRSRRRGPHGHRDGWLFQISRRIITSGPPGRCGPCSMASRSGIAGPSRRPRFAIYRARSNRI